MKTQTLFNCSVAAMMLASGLAHGSNAVSQTVSAFDRPSLSISLGNKSAAEIATPAPIFEPILPALKQQLPPELLMRLPSRIRLLDYKGQPIDLYAAINPTPQNTLMGLQDFAIQLNSQPNCKARFCQVGAIAVTQDHSAIEKVRSEKVLSQSEKSRIKALRGRGYDNLSKSERHFLYSTEGVLLTRAPISLKPGLKGVFYVTSPMGASTPASMSVIWEQDGLVFRLSVGCALDSNGEVPQDAKSTFLDTAISMAKQPPIN